MNENTRILPDNEKVWNTIKPKFASADLDYSKLNRQISVFRKWVKSLNGRGYFQAVTGFGKTMELLIAILVMNASDPLKNTIIVVPNTNLYNDWCDPKVGYIASLGLINVKVYVVNTFTKDLNLRYQCTLLGLDEGHRYARDEAEKFSKVLNITNFRFVMILSATLGKREKEFFTAFGIHQIDEINLDEAQNNGWISKFTVFNIPAHLSSVDKEREQKYTKNFNVFHSYFNYDFELARGCNIADEKRLKHSRYGWLSGKQYREIVARNMQISTQEVRKLAGQWYINMTQRKGFLHQVENKTLVAEEILNKTNYKTIFFSENTNVADSLKLRLGDEAAVYHSNLTTQIFENENSTNVIAIGEKVKGKTGMYRTLVGNKLLSYKELKTIYPNAFRLTKNKLKGKVKHDFANNLYRVLLTSKALDEGYDCRDIVMGIVHSGSGKKLQSTQRFGRVLRVDADKEAYIVNIYVKDTQDEKWLVNRLKGVPSSRMHWVKDVDEMIEIINSNKTDKNVDLV